MLLLLHGLHRLLLRATKVGWQWWKKLLSHVPIPSTPHSNTAPKSNQTHPASPWTWWWWEAGRHNTTSQPNAWQLLLFRADAALSHHPSCGSLAAIPEASLCAACPSQAVCLFPHPPPHCSARTLGAPDWLAQEKFLLLSLHRTGLPVLRANAYTEETDWTALPSVYWLSSQGWSVKINSTAELSMG